MGSRVLGLVREIVMVSYLGLGTDMGAFTVATKVPNLVRTLLADTALSAALTSSLPTGPAPSRRSNDRDPSRTPSPTSAAAPAEIRPAKAAAPPRPNSPA